MIDYKQQYLKYKFKYLSAQSQNNLSGGSIEIFSSVAGLSVAALIAGVTYYLYINNINKSETCLNELENKITNTPNLYEKRKLEELRIAHQNAIDNYDDTCKNENDIYENKSKTDPSGKANGLFPPNPYNPLQKKKSLKDFSM
jgi:uncharacterized membrane protein YciS (DUF1049 family)